MRLPTRGIKGSHHSSHAGSSYHLSLEALGLEHLQHPNVGQAPGPAS